MNDKYRLIEGERHFSSSKEITQTPNQSPNKLSHTPILSLVRERALDVQQYTDKINDKTVVSIYLQQEKIKQKKLMHLISQLERIKLQLEKLQEKYKQQESIETHPQIREDVENLQKVEQYKQSLMNKAGQLTDNLEINNRIINDLKSQVYQKRQLIRELTQDSWDLQGEIKKHRGTRYNQSMELFPRTAQCATSEVFLTNPQFSSYKSNSNTITLPPLSMKPQRIQKIKSMVDNATLNDEKIKVLVDMLKKMNSVQNQINNCRDEIHRRANKFNQLRNLLHDSIQTTIKYFENKQKIVGINGFADSMFFDISTQNITVSNRSMINESSILLPIKSKNQPKFDSTGRNVLYETLQQLIINMLRENAQLLPLQDQQSSQASLDALKDSTRKNHKTMQKDNQFSQLISQKVPMEMFLQFTPQQILGILTLNSNLIQELTGVFDIKCKSLGLTNKKLKILLSQSE